jgi:hypothetical protein
LVCPHDPQQCPTTFAVLATFATHHPADVGLAHQPLDAFAANANAVLDGEFGVDAWGAVDATVLAMGLEDPFDQLRVLFGARAGNVGGQS